MRRQYLGYRSSGSSARGSALAETVAAEEAAGAPWAGIGDQSGWGELTESVLFAIAAEPERGEYVNVKSAVGQVGP